MNGVVVVVSIPTSPITVYQCRRGLQMVLWIHDTFQIKDTARESRWTYVFRRIQSGFADPSEYTIVLGIHSCSRRASPYRKL
jgi:hypothetical protein